jgi:hypothetical protein
MRLECTTRLRDVAAGNIRGTIVATSTPRNPPMWDEEDKLHESAVLRAPWPQLTTEQPIAVHRPRPVAGVRLCSNRSWFHAGLSKSGLEKSGLLYPGR